MALNHFAGVRIMGTKTKASVVIKSVRTVRGSEFERFWGNDIQRVVTDKGEYIDRGVTNYYQTPGYDWSKLIGKNVEVYISEQTGKSYKWIEFISSKSTYETPTIHNKVSFTRANREEERKSLKILDVKVYPGKEIESNWKNDMQVVYTDHGTYIDTTPVVYYKKKGCDWASVVGKTVDVVIKKESDKEYAWIDFAADNGLDVLGTHNPAYGEIRQIVSKMKEQSINLKNADQFSYWQDYIQLFSTSTNNFLEKIVIEYTQLFRLHKQEKINQSITQLKDNLDKDLVNDLHFLNTFRNRLIHKEDRKLFKNPSDEQEYFTNDALACYTKAKLLLQQLEDKSNQ